MRCDAVSLTFNACMIRYIMAGSPSCSCRGPSAFCTTFTFITLCSTIGSVSLIFSCRSLSAFRVIFYLQLIDYPFSNHQNLALQHQSCCPTPFLCPYLLYLLKLGQSCSNPRLLKANQQQLWPGASSHLSNLVRHLRRSIRCSSDTSRFRDQ